MSTKRACTPARSKASMNMVKSLITALSEKSVMATVGTGQSAERESDAQMRKKAATHESISSNCATERFVAAKRLKLAVLASSAPIAWSRDMPAAPSALNSQNLKLLSCSSTKRSMRARGSSCS